MVTYSLVRYIKLSKYSDHTCNHFLRTQHHTCTDYKSLQHYHVYDPAQPQQPHLDIAIGIALFELYIASRGESNEVYQAFDRFRATAMSFS